jgi:hypothetical protein
MQRNMQRNMQDMEVCDKMQNMQMSHHGIFGIFGMTICKLCRKMARNFFLHIDLHIAAYLFVNCCILLFAYCCVLFCK